MFIRYDAISKYWYMLSFSIDLKCTVKISIDVSQELYIITDTISISLCTLLTI
jgi:hypothetical protein